MLVRHYNIPSNNRELQPESLPGAIEEYYNIPSNNRELQQNSIYWYMKLDYNIPSNNRELQQSFTASTPISIITYQVITGNYSSPRNQRRKV